MKTEVANKEIRILARSLTRELTAEEIALVAGRGTKGCPPPTSTCQGSDNNSCDMDCISCN